MRDERLVTIAEFGTIAEACIVKGVLEQAGIRVLVPEEHMVRLRGGLFPGNIFPVGTIQVFESDRSRAIAELRRHEIRLVKPTPAE